MKRNTAIPKADTCTSTTFIEPEHKKYLRNIISVTHRSNVHLPNNYILTPTDKGILALHDSPDISTYILPGMKNASLLSIDQLYDKGYVVVF